MKRNYLQGRAVAILFISLTLGSSTTSGQDSSLLHAPGPPPRAEVIPTPMPSSGSSPTPMPLPPPTALPMPSASRGGPPIANVSPRGLIDHNPAVGLQGVSWTYQQAPPLRQFRVQDIIQIRVDEIARLQAAGQQEKRRNSIFLAVLSDWLKLTRGGIVPDPQEEGSPTVGAQAQSNFRAEARLEARESLTFNVAARVVDIRPNGNLVLEARKSLRHNDNLWETTLTGTCRAQDIGPDNVILSKDMIDLEINKEDQGNLRDSYKRGWFQKAMDRVKPF